MRMWFTDLDQDLDVLPLINVSIEDTTLTDRRTDGRREKRTTEREGEGLVTGRILNCSDLKDSSNSGSTSLTKLENSGGQASLNRLYELLPREIPNIQHKGVPLTTKEVKNRRGGTTVVQNGVPSLFEKARSNTKLSNMDSVARGTIIIVKSGRVVRDTLYNCVGIASTVWFTRDRFHVHKLELKLLKNQPWGSSSLC
ncbi:hypothetical protein J6590_039131 [Homalodisca vitripennis]|nr:hypothetical protein J6590_039131 [Homalodisca vitripennis]